MKKNLFKLLTLLLALCMILCACGNTNDDDDDDDRKSSSKLSDEEMIVGTWEGGIDCGDYFNDVMVESMGEEMGSYFDFDGLELTIIMEFTDDGECTMGFDVDKFADDTLEILTDNMHDMMEEMLADTLNGQSLDDYLDDNGMDFDELMASADLDLDELADDLADAFDSEPETWDYEISRGEITIDGDVHEYELDKDTLTLEAPEGTEDDEMAELLFPMELEKVD